MNKKVTGAKIAAAGWSVLLMGSVVLGCSPQSGGNAGKEAGKADAGGFPEPYKLTMMVDNITPDIPPADSPSMKFIEDITQTDLELTWVPGSNYNEKLNATIASGDMPKVVVSLRLKTPSIVNAIRSDVFWEIGPYLKDYPRLNEMNPVLKNNVLMDGKMYAIPRHLDLAFNAVTYRSDWTEKVGMQPPKSLDDLYQLAKAFTEKDPDRNGKNDTYGVLETGTLGGMSSVVVFAGGANGWEETNGKFTPVHETAEYMTALNWYKRLYSEKLMNQDFPALTGVTGKELYTAGKGGIYMGTASQVSELVLGMQKTNPEADMHIAEIVSPKGERHYPTLGFSGVYLIPKSSVKTEAELKRILQYFERLADPKIQTFMQFGLEGIHYKLENGKPTKTDEALYQKEVNVLRRLKPHTMSEMAEGNDAPTMQRVFGFYKAKEDKVVGDPSMPFISDTYTERGQELDKIINNARVQYVMGVMDESGWHKAVEEWRKKGGDQVVKDYEEQFAKSKK
jgi:putative aldouronate transport system substrate-binding protein